jgi:protein-L-isoaspartate(D-aspartate) O-methyltransferase
MVERQLRRRGIWDERVLEAMDEVPREEFLPDRVRSDAYNDSALPIGHEQTISQPWVVAAICQ